MESRKSVSASPPRPGPQAAAAGILRDQDSRADVSEPRHSGQAPSSIHAPRRAVGAAGAVHCQRTMRAGRFEIRAVDLLHDPAGRGAGQPAKPYPAQCCGPPGLTGTDSRGARRWAGQAWARRRRSSSRREASNLTARPPVVRGGPRQQARPGQASSSGGTYRSNTRR
ncbi:hypothetical protein ACCO45_002126 [Purpureocillium lilacinum]|uniref:Uncharacterized protein n=1 Tax=Purpureocillium lilacinum TaxID=33203 RepID=A0ACC4E951_PURLI